MKSPNHSLRRFLLYGVVLMTWSAGLNCFAQESPRLKDFGRSLKDKQKNPKQPTKTDDDDVVRVQTDLVVCDVLVVDKTGNVISGLAREDFTVNEDDSPQQIGTFSLGDNANLGRSIVLILDYSNSQLPYIKTSVEAAKSLVDKLGPKDRMALVTDDVRLLVDFTHDKALLKGALESLKQRALSGRVGMSLQYSALMATLNEMFDSEDIRPIVIFQTDGDQLEKLKDGRNALSNLPFRDIARAVEKSRVTLYSVIPGASLLDLNLNQRVQKLRAAEPDKVLATGAWQTFAHQRYEEQMAIARLMKLSGGWPDFLEKPEQADAVYARIFNDLNNRYVIGYYPTNKAHDGKRRSVKIEVRGHPEYVVWGRKTYLAPQQ